MAKHIILNKESDWEIRLVDGHDFYSRDIVVTDEENDAITAIYDEYLVLRAWFTECYNRTINNPGASIPELPESLLQARAPRCDPEPFKYSKAKAKPKKRAAPKAKPVVIEKFGSAES